MTLPQHCRLDPAVADTVRECYFASRSHDDTIERVKTRHGLTWNRNQVSYYRRVLGLTGRNQGRYSSWKAEWLDWLREHRPHLTLPETTAALNAHFGTTFTAMQVQGACGYHGIRRRPEDKAGLHPVTWRPIGSYSRDVDGFWYLKVRDWLPGSGNRGAYELVHHLTYRTHIGPIPPKHIVCFLDGNRDNCLDPDNLIAIPRALIAQLNNLGFGQTNDPAIRRALIAQAHLAHATRRAARRIGLSEHYLKRQRGNYHAKRQPLKDPIGSAKTETAHAHQP